jgi:SAM-dependent methyltransferase
MAERCHYVSSDFDLRAHQGDIALDLQRLGLAGDSLDVLLTAHVLEHLPDTDAALAEMRRVLRPGGRLFLAVPVLQGRTAPPTKPEYHGDQTLVYWRFGFDLTDRLRQHGFVTNVLVPRGYRRLVKAGGYREGNGAEEFDVPSILAAARHDDMQVIADARESRRMGFEPAFMFLVWECLKGG